MDFSGIDHTLKMMDQMIINQTKVIYEVVEPYQLGTKRRFTNCSEWLDNLPENKDNYKNIN